MAKKINLLTLDAAGTEPRIVKKTMPYVSGSFILAGLIVLVAIAVTVYGLMLSREKSRIENDIANLERKIETYREIEEKKAVLTLKTDDIQTLYGGRFDYVQAIDDVQKLFAYSLTINQIDLQDDKTAKVNAVKTGEIIISAQEALATQIEELTLELILPSSGELQDTVDNLKRYLGQGLTSADVIESKKLEEEEGYQVNFLLTFGSIAEEGGGLPPGVTLPSL